jgi:hypothetical protein
MLSSRRAYGGQSPRVRGSRVTRFRTDRSGQSPRVRGSQKEADLDYCPVNPRVCGGAASQCGE